MSSVSLSVVPADADAMAQWDSRIADADGGSVFQTTMWGNYLQSYVGGQPFYWAARKENGAIAGLLLVISTSPAWQVFFERPLGRVLLPIARSVFPTYEALSGPVVLDPQCRSAVNHAFAHHLKRWACGTGLMRRITVTSAPSLCSEVRPSEFGLCDYRATVLQTLLVDIDRSEEDLWSALHRSARKAVSRAQREGLSVRRISEIEELRQMYPEVVDGRKQVGLRTFSFRNWEVMWEWLGPTDAIHMFAAERDGQMHACLGIWAFGTIIQEWNSVRMLQNSPAGDLLKWEVIQWGRRHGFTTYDLAGINLSPDATEKEQAIARYKLKWGGAPVSFERHTSQSVLVLCRRDN